MTSRQTTAFPRGACGHAMQDLGWILLPQLRIWESLHQPALRLAPWERPSKWLHMICRSAALEVESEARRCQISTMPHFTWGSSGVRPQAAVSFVWTKQVRLSAVHQFGSADGETLLKRGQLLGNHHYLLYGGSIGSATILLYLEDLWDPDQHAILRLKKSSIQRNIIDKLLQRRRKQLRSLSWIQPLCMDCLTAVRQPQQVNL